MYTIIFNIHILVDFQLVNMVSSRINFRFLCLIKIVIISEEPSYLTTILSEKIDGYSVKTHET